jgi:hypothetical protein
MNDNETFPAWLCQCQWMMYMVIQSIFELNNFNSKTDQSIQTRNREEVLK